MKLNGITLLHDARYCAAAGVAYITYPIAPPYANGLDANALQEILGWIEGPVPVLDFGTDPAALQFYLDTQTPPPAVMYQLDASVDFPPAVPAAQRIVRYAPETDTDAAEVRFVLGSQTESAFAIELAPTGPLSAAVLTAAVLAAPNLMLCLDHLPLDAAKGLPLQPLALSLGQRVLTPEGELDFDALEATGLVSGL